VHYGEALCGWQYRSKDKVVKMFEKEKEEDFVTEPCDWL
jgi:hypothetical protein